LKKAFETLPEIYINGSKKGEMKVILIQGKDNLVLRQFIHDKDNFTVISLKIIFKYSINSVFWL
jgi:hypothetical protein